MKRFLSLALRLTIAAAGLWSVVALAAGRVGAWGPLAWAGVIWVSAVATHAAMLRLSPGLLEERLAPASDRDVATRRLVALPMLAHLVLAGLDLRFGWSRVPLAAQLFGLALVAAGFTLVAWVLLSNPFASSAVRVQPERSHRVISTGPYGVVRHPMYLAVLLVSLGSGAAFGSWWAGLAMVPVVAAFLRRTLLEDRMLRDELDGYQAYSERVRWRVVPMVF
jgi:protein-S-isoprenylcysteine O-methyltransferase Ste14